MRRDHAREYRRLRGSGRRVCCGCVSAVPAAHGAAGVMCREPRRRPLSFMASSLCRLPQKIRSCSLCVVTVQKSIDSRRPRPRLPRSAPAWRCRVTAVFPTTRQSATRPRSSLAPTTRSLKPDPGKGTAIQRTGVEKRANAEWRRPAPGPGSWRHHVGRAASGSPCRSDPGC
jgi:hypothetical protein